MSTTYPPAASTLSGDYITISRFLQNPTLVARRLQDILQYRFIADRLLTARLQVAGGAIQFETSGESIFANDDPRALAPGAEYPLTTIGTGPISMAKTVKWGQDSIITDESIKRQLMDPVSRTMLKLANSQVRYIDSIAMSAITTSITATQAATASWVTASPEQILLDVETAKASILNLNQGYDPDVIVVDQLTYARVWSKFLAAGLFPREGSNPIAQNIGAATQTPNGVFPTIDGLTWLPTVNHPSPGTALIMDTAQLGGMADEDLGGPGYATAGGVGVQVKTMRLDETDGWRLRCRRVTVPVVLEPACARKITGVAA